MEVVGEEGCPAGTVDVVTRFRGRATLLIPRWRVQVDENGALVYKTIISPRDPGSKVHERASPARTTMPPAMEGFKARVQLLPCHAGGLRLC